MKRFSGLAFAAVILSGCAAAHDRLEGPVVEMTNIDPVKYYRDLGECTQAKKDVSFVGSAGMITNCMRDRGYTILTPKG
jgi:hypothetical protein